MIEDVSLPFYSSLFHSLYSFCFLHFHPHEFLYSSLSGSISFFHNTLFTSRFRQAIVGAKKDIKEGPIYVNVNWKIGEPIQRKGLWNFSNNCRKGSTKVVRAEFSSLKSQLTQKQVRIQRNKVHLLYHIWYWQVLSLLNSPLGPQCLLEYPNHRH
jgi:hypothetical protein